MEAVLAALAAGDSVITANNRLVRSIDLAWQRRQRAAGRSAWRTPHLLPWHAWIEELWWSSLTAQGDAGRHALLTDFQARLAWRHIVRHADASRLGGASPLAELAWRAWRLSADWLLTPERIARAADSEDSQQFAEWATTYASRCAAEGWADAGAILPLLAADLRRSCLPIGRSLHFCGFVEWTPLQRQFLHALESAGVSVRELPAPRAQGHASGRVSCRDGRAELETAARWARRHAELEPARAVAVVVPDLAARSAEVRREFLEVFAPGWQLAPATVAAVNFSWAAPLADTGLFRAAAIALRALAGTLDFRDAGSLLRTPYLQGSAAEAGGRAILDFRMRGQIGTMVDLAALAERAAPAAPVLCSRLRALAAVAAALPRQQGAAAWADSFRAALETLGWPGERPLGSDEYQAAMACQELWATLRGCDRFTGALTLDGALTLIESLAQDRSFQPAGHPEAVQVLGILEALGQHFDALWICGLSSESWPPAVRPSPLLSLALQRELRMPDSSPAVARERSERILHWLLSSARHVIASWPEFAGEEPLAPSPLIAGLPLASVEALDLSVARRRADAMMAHPAAAVVPADPPPALVAPGVRGGAGLLEQQARCPARAFVQYRLGARELAAPVPGIDAATRGAITHAVLHGFFTRIRTHEQLCGLTQPEARALLEPIIAAVLAEWLPLGQPLIASLARNEAARLRSLVERFLETERARPPFEVRWTESMPAVDPTAPSRAVPHAVEQLGIALRPDRVDALPDGRMLIIDYKTGRELPAARDLWSDRLRSPQLPLYATMTGADGIAFVHLAAGPVRWRGVGRDSWDIPGMSDPADFTRHEVADWGRLRARWWTALERLAEEIFAGSFTIDRWRRREATGQWAMATRVYELLDEEEVEE